MTTIVAPFGKNERQFRAAEDIASRSREGVDIVASGVPMAGTIVLKLKTKEFNTLTRSLTQQRCPLRSRSSRVLRCLCGEGVDLGRRSFIGDWL